MPLGPDASRSSPDFMAASPFAHIAYTLDLKIIDLNWRHEKLTGVPRERAVGRDLYEVFPPNPNDPKADSRAAVLASLKRMVATRDSDDMDAFKHDLPKAGGGFEERYWRVTHSPIWSAPNGGGEIIGALQTTREITEDVRRQRIAVAQRRAATTAGSIAFFELDLRTETVTASDTLDAMFGLERGDGADRPVEAYLARMHGEDRAEAEALLSGARDQADHSENRIDFRILLPDGAVRWAVSTMELVRSGDGEAPTLTGVVLDVTQIKRTEEELRKALKARDLLLAEVNHRVKNSLQLVTSVLNLEARAARGSEMAVRLESAASRVRAISSVHAVLYQTENVRSVDLSAFLRTLVTHISSSSGAMERNIAVKIETPDRPVEVSTDKAVSLSLIVNEIVTNSFKHAFPGDCGGTIFVSLSLSGDDCVKLAIADDGVGKKGTKARKPALDVESTGLGSRLIVSLAKQLGAELSFPEQPGGHSVLVEFSVIREAGEI